MADQPPLLDRPADDVQARRPATRVSLSRVGVTGLERAVHLRPGTAGAELFSADLECYVDLRGDQRGAHMSRFSETVGAAVDEVALSGTFRAEVLAGRVAERVLDLQGARRAEVRIAARYPEQRTTPASGLPTQETFTLLGAAVAGELDTRRAVGVEAQGITACPCAQELVTARARARLEEEGFGDEEIERILRAVPVATHNQRGVGTLWVGSTGPEDDHAVDARELLTIIESSMSSEIYGLMKRSDEVEVVERAHRRPRFVEDCVREMVRMSAERFGSLEGAHLHARQRNLESIHRHDVVAERYGLIADLAAEIAEGPSARHLSMADWLEGVSLSSG
jgi:GTP cyclohydrolase-4